MKKIYIRLTYGLSLFLITTNLFSQGIVWNSTNLTASRYQENSFTLSNNTDNSIKVIILDNNYLITSKVLGSKSTSKIIFPVDEVSEEYLRNLIVQVYYDTECYNNDLNLLNQIAKQRYLAAKNKKEIKVFFRSLFSLTETFTPEDWWIHKRAVEGNAFMDVYDTWEDYKSEGLSRAFINLVESNFKSETYKDVSKYLTGSEKSGEIASKLEGLYDLVNSELKFETDDLELAALLSYSYISSDPIYRYSIPFDIEFQKAIDRDGDGITNRKDNCPNTYGIQKYNGCTKEIYESRRKEEKRIARKERKKGYPKFMVGADYFVSNFAPSQDVDYNSNTYMISGFNFNAKVPLLIHKVGPVFKGALLPNGSVRTSIFKYIGGEEGAISFFNETYYNIGISYGLLIGPNSRIKLMIEPTYGIVLNSSVKTGSFSIGGNEVEDDFFQIANNQQKAKYKGISTHLIFGKSANYKKNSRGFTASIPVALSFGILQYDSIPVSINPNLSSGILFEDGTEYEYPDKFLNYHFGLTIVF